MTFNLNYAEMLGREQLKERRREAERERLIRSLTPANPPVAKKVWYILLSRWQESRRAKAGRQGYPAIRKLSDQSLNL